MLGFLGDVLGGESRWQLGEVQHLLALHTLVAIRRRDAEGLGAVGPVDGQRPSPERGVNGA